MRKCYEKGLVSRHDTGREQQRCRNNTNKIKQVRSVMTARRVRDRLKKCSHALSSLAKLANGKPVIMAVNDRVLIAKAGFGH